MVITHTGSAAQTASKGAAQFGEPLLRILLSSVIDSIVLFDERGLIQLFNAGSEKLFGFSAGEIVGRNFDVLVPLPAHIVDGGHRQLVGTRSEMTGRHKDQSPFQLCVSINQGELAGECIFVGVMNDLTDHKLDEKVRWNERKLQAMLNGVTDAIVTVDFCGMVESFSPSASALFGYSAGEVVGRPVTMLMPSPYSEAAVTHLKRLLNKSGTRPVNGGRVVIGRKRDGSAFPMEIAVGEASEGNHGHFIGFIRDITARAGTEQRLEQLQSELLRVSRVDAMSHMTMAIAHELNQPLAAIANYVGAVKQGLGQKKLTPNIIENAEELIDKASEQALRAAAIVKGLRGFVEKRETDRDYAELGLVIEEALALAFVNAASKGVIVKLDFDRSLPAILMDRVQIQQVLFNLIGNSLEAMQFAGKRELTLATRQQDGFAEVSVADTGPGLPDFIIDQLFKPFTTSKHSGMGVGLTICQTIVETHAGSIWLAKSSAEGAEFRFRLPMPSPADAQP